MIKRVDHVGIAVKELELALNFYTAGLGMALQQICAVEEQEVKVAFLPAGEGAIELLEPLGKDSSLWKFLERRGEGIHHICLEVDDLPACLDRLARLGYELIDRVPRQGAHGWIAFVHPRSAHGVLIELMRKDVHE